MYTIRQDRPLNPVILAVIKRLHAIATQRSASYFLIGAAARDILMTHVFGIEAVRATRDVDFAIALEDWNQFDIVKRDIVGTGDFTAATGQAHRFHYRPGEFRNAYPLDLIPFGDIENKDHVIAWPPDMDVVMNVAGYGEAHASAIPVDIGDGLIISVVSIPALAALKLFAWDDRGLLDNKDAQDLYYLLKNYRAAGNDERLYADAYSLLETCDYDSDLAGAALLGYELKLILRHTTLNALLTVLNDPVKRDRLAIHMDRSITADSAMSLKYIEKMALGLSLPNL